MLISVILEAADVGLEEASSSIVTATPALAET
jgi:hypothetical protein